MAHKSVTSCIWRVCVSLLENQPSYHHTVAHLPSKPAKWETCLHSVICSHEWKLLINESERTKTSENTSQYHGEIFFFLVPVLVLQIRAHELFYLTCFTCRHSDFCFRFFFPCRHRHSLWNYLTQQVTSQKRRPHVCSHGRRRLLATSQRGRCLFGSSHDVCCLCDCAGALTITISILCFSTLVALFF